MAKRCLIALVVIAGCHADTTAPPLEALPLRDALGAHPSTIAALPHDARLALARRFAEAMHAATPSALAITPEATAEASVRAFDASRTQAGDDAAVLVALAGDRVGEMRRPDVRAAGVRALFLPELEGADEHGETYELEDLALEGEAGIVLAEALAGRRTMRLVRVTRWPAAVVAATGRDGDVIYVNASWLVAMSALDDDAGVVPPTDAGLGQPPKKDSSCSVAGASSSRERRLFWIVGPLVFVLAWGQWRHRSKRG